MMSNPAQSSGATLVGLVVAVAIIGIAVSGVLMLISQLIRNSADPMQQVQAAAIAESYLNEILAKPLRDPQDGETGRSERGERRASYDDVFDYVGLRDDSGARDFRGQRIPGLEAFDVFVNVRPGRIGGLRGARVRVTVTRDHETDPLLTLSGWKLAQ